MGVISTLLVIVTMLSGLVIFEPHGAVVMLEGDEIMAAENVALRVDGPAQAVKVQCLKGRRSWGCRIEPLGEGAQGTYTVEAVYWVNSSNLVQVEFLNGSTKGRKFRFITLEGNHRLWMPVAIR